MTKRALYNIALGIVALYTWYIPYKAGLKEYDDNYGMIIHSFIVSLVASVVVGVLWLRRNAAVREAKFETIVFLLIASPVSVVFAITHYEVTFHVTLRN